MLVSFVSGSCGSRISDAQRARDSKHRLLEGKSFSLVWWDAVGVPTSPEIPRNMSVAELLAGWADFAFVGSFAGFATEPNAVREVETNLVPDFPRGPWVLAVFRDVRVIQPDGTPVPIDLPLAITVGLAREAIGPNEHAIIVGSMDVVPKVGHDYLYLGPMAYDQPERCVDVIQVFIGNGLFETRGDSVVDRDGALVALASLRPRLSSLPPWADPAVLEADDPAQAISADISRHLPPWLVPSPAERARVPIVAKRCADAADDIGGPYATVADVQAALFAP